MLLSSGDFAVYLAESNVFNLLAPRFGDLAVKANRERLIDAWLQSKLFRASFVNEQQIRETLASQCKSSGDFLRIVMDEMAKAQGVRRWADNSPEELLHARSIKRALPEALFIHMIRDGRDVALSLDARPHKWVRPFAWDRPDSLLVTGLFWEWMVQRGRKECAGVGSDSIEVRFEDLQSDPQRTLKKIGDFIVHDLDYDRILKVGIGSVSEPNTSFKGDSGNPAGRWKKKMSSETLARFERLVGTTLGSLGYELSSDDGARSMAERRMRALYRAYFETKFWFKNSAVGRRYLGPMSGQQIDDTVIATDPAAQTVQKR